MKIAVFGDFIVDKYSFYTSTKTTPEANVPILEFDNEKKFPGGAFLLSSILDNIGFEIDFYTNVGEEIYKQLNASVNIFDSKININSTIKERIILDNKYIHRIDSDVNITNSKKFIKECIENFQSNISSYSALVVADYNKGFLNNDFTEQINKIARENNLLTFLDPKPNNKINLNNWSYIKPNFLEASEISKTEDLDEIIKYFTSKLKTNLFLTLGESGCIFSDGVNTYKKDSSSNKFIDLSGCGDAALAGFIKGILIENDIDLALEHAMTESAKVMKQFGPWNKYK